MTKIARLGIAPAFACGALAVSSVVLLAQMASAGTGGAPAVAASDSPSPSATASSSPSASPSATPSSEGGRYAALDTPTRAFDSRSTSERRRSGVTTVDLSPSLPSTATAAVLNVTLTEAEAGGHAVVYATGSDKPATSNVNVQTGLTKANEVITLISSDRRVDVSIDGGPAALVVDVVGFFTADESVAAGQVKAVTPERVFDSGQIDQPRRSGETQVDLSEKIGDATAVVLNVTVDAPDLAGHLVVHPTGSAKPATSNVNFAKGQQQANEVFTEVGTDGRVSLSLDGPTPPRARLVVDLVATIGEDTATEVTVTSPRRFLDTRPGAGNVGAPAGSKSGPVTVSLPDSVPSEATAVVLNVTTTGADAPGYVTVYADGAANPGTSNVNFRVGADQANEVVTLISSDRKVVLDVGGRNAPGTYLVADVTGYLTQSCTPGLLPGIIGPDCSSSSPSPSPSASASPSPSPSPSASTSPSASASPSPSTSCLLPPPAPCI